MSGYTKNAREVAASVAATRTYKTSRGIELTIHAVPQTIIRSIVPKRPKPVVPNVEMQLPKGGTQKRPAKAGDPVWDSYTAELEAWEKERDDLQEAITYCMALKTYPFPAAFTLSPELTELVDAGLLKLPDDPYLLKFMWIRENLLGQHDEYNVNMMIQELSGVPEDIIQSMKESFRNILLGKNAPAVGARNENNSTDAKDDQADGEVQ